MQNEQLPTESHVFKDEVLAGAKRADNPPNEMPERLNHGKNIIPASPALRIRPSDARNSATGFTFAGLSHAHALSRHASRQLHSEGNGHV